MPCRLMRSLPWLWIVPACGRRARSSIRGDPGRLSPTRPAPQVGPLLGQAATALALSNMRRPKPRETVPKKHASIKSRSGTGGEPQSLCRERQAFIAADRIERAVAPWSAYVILPLFAFSATGVNLAVDYSAPGAWSILAGVILGLAIGKPLGSRSPRSRPSPHAWRSRPKA